MSEGERLLKAIRERDLAQARLRKARNALYRIAKLSKNQRITRIAQGGVGEPKTRKLKTLPGQIDLEEWLASGVTSQV